MMVRPAHETDVRDIYKIHTSSIRDICSKCYTGEEIKSWISRQSEERYKDSIRKGDILVVDDDGKLKGFAHFSQEVDNKVVNTLEDTQWPVVFVRALYVHPDHVGKGVGGQLLDHIQTKAQQQQAKKLM